MKLKNILSLPSQRSFMTAVFFVSLLLTACRKEPGSLGSVVQPAGDVLQGTLVDTFTVITYSTKVDSLRTDELSNNMVGSIVDPVFGKTQMGIFTQIQLSSNNPVFDVPNTVIDSVVLSMVYETYYGTNGAQDFHVYEVLDTMYKDSTYYNTSSLITDPTDLVLAGYTTQTPDYINYFHDPVTGDSAKPQLRLVLDNNLGQRIINESGTGSLVDNNTFTKFIKGLYITVNNPSQNSGEGSIISIDMLDADTKVSIYYHETTSGDTLAYFLNVNENCARFTKADHDYSATAIEAQLADSTMGQQYTYLQAGAGLTVDFKFPTLMHLKDQGNIIINKAEVFIPVQYYNLDPLFPPLRVLLFSYNADGTTSVLQDQFDGDQIYGGYYDDATKSYVLSIGRYLQDVFSGTRDNLGLQLNAASSSVTALRAILSGSGADNRSKPYLKIIYTKY